MRQHSCTENYSRVGTKLDQLVQVLAQVQVQVHHRLSKKFHRLGSSRVFQDQLVVYIGYCCRAPEVVENCLKMEIFLLR